MKKVLSFITAVLMLFCCAFAESSSLDSYTTEQIKYAADYYQQEYIKRLGEPFTVGAGVYTVGENFPAGTYSVDMVEDPKAGIQFYVYRDFNSYYYDDFKIPLFSVYFTTLYNTTHIDYLTLYPGNIVTISNSSLVFSPASGLFQ